MKASLNAMKDVKKKLDEWHLRIIAINTNKYHYGKPIRTKVGGYYPPVQDRDGDT